MMNSIVDESEKMRKRGFMRIFKTKKVLVGIFIIAIAATSGYYFFFREEDTSLGASEPKEWTVKKDNLQIAVESDGKVVAKDGVELSFSVSGDTLEVMEVYVKEGDVVKKGDKIASVKTDDLQYALQKAYASYQAVLASYNEDIAGPTENEVNDAKYAVEQAEISLEQAEISLAKTITSDEEKIRSAEQALDTAEDSLLKNQDEVTSEDVRDAYDDLVDLIKATNIFCGGILDDSDKILGIDDEFINDDFEHLLGVKEVQTMILAEGSYEEAKENMLELDDYAVFISLGSSYIEIDQAAEQAFVTLKSFEKHLYDMQNLLNATIVSTGLTQGELDSFRATISSSRSSVNTQSTSLNNGIKSVDNAKDGLDEYITAHENAVLNLDNAKKELEQDVITGNSSIKTKEIALAQSQENLEELLEPLSESEQASLNSSLTSAVVSLNQAKSNLEKSTLTAPIDGEVALLNYKAGDIIVTNDSKPVVSIINKNTLFIEVNIEESDINKIKVGQKADATFDAADGLKLEGEVSFISVTSETSSNGIVTYLVRVVFDNTEEGQIREGMTAAVNFVTAGVADVLIAPVGAVKNVDGKPSVQSASGEWLPVATGFTDGKYVEIISGLSAGDKILY